MPEILVVADDLTGACDSGSAFLRAGRGVRVWLDCHAADNAAESVWVFSTETRNASPEDARRAMNAIAGALWPSPSDILQASHPGPLLFKKIDSAGRGNIGPELLQALESFACDVVVCAPAFPQLGRTVLRGVLRVSDLAGQRALIPLAALFPNENVTALVGSGDAALLRQGLRDAQGSGARIWLCDAQTQSDLDCLVAAVQSLPLRVLWAGSGGLALALAAALPVRAGEISTNELAEKSSSGCTLVFAGTPHAVTRMQLERLVGEPGVRSLEQESDWFELPTRGCGLLHVACGSTTDEEIRAIWNRASELIGVGALVLTGGDTAALVLRALGALSIELRGEVAAGIPWGKVCGGFAYGCFVATKSGGFGGEMALVEAVEFLREKTR